MTLISFILKFSIMRAVIQRVKNATVIIDEETKTSIRGGLLILLGVEREDKREDADWLANKIAGLRIFDDARGVMNLNVSQTNGDLMVISQFTLHAKTRKGNRPSYIQAAPPDQSEPLYSYFIEKISGESGIKAKTGTFGAEMDVNLVNSGPVTIIIDTKNKE